MKRKSKTESPITVYFRLIVFMVFLKIIFFFTPFNHIIPKPKVDMFALIVFLVFVFGFIGLSLARKAGFPEIWDRRISNRERFISPMICGVAFSSIIMLIDIIEPIGNVYSWFPLSMPYYLFGRVVSEIDLYLFPLPLFIWILMQVLHKRKLKDMIFKPAAMIFCLYEPICTLLIMLKMDLPGQFLEWYFLCEIFLSVYIFSLFSAYFFRKAGFLAALTMRFSFYTMWHLVWICLL